MESLRTGGDSNPAIPTSARSPLRPRILLVLLVALLVGWGKSASSENSSQPNIPICRSPNLLAQADSATVGVIGNVVPPPLVPQTYLEGKCIPPYAVALPVFGPAGSTPRVDALSHRNLTITMKEIDQAVLPQGLTDTCGKGIKFGKTRVWAYETSDTTTRKILGPANWPAVTIEARKDFTNSVTFINQLPSFNPANPSGPGLVQAELAVDQTIHWADPMNLGCGMMAPMDCTLPANETNPCCQQYTGPVPATVHLHGGVLPASFDGGPDSWFTPDGRTGPSYVTVGKPKPGQATYNYLNTQAPGTLWFHDHTLGTTRLNVAAGLAGFYFIENPIEEPKGLPQGRYQIEMALQDRLFDTTSQLYFPEEIQLKEHPFWSPMYEGDVAVVNGAPWPYLNVEPRRYRFRILNGSNHRGYTLQFGSSNTPQPDVYQIGADEAYFDKPVKITELKISPADRADIIVDFSKFAGKTINVTNSTAGQMFQISAIMQFHVTLPRQGIDTSCDPARPVPLFGLCASPVPTVRLTDGQGNMARGVKIDKTRQIVLNENVQFPITIEELQNNTKWNGQLSPSIAAEFPTDGISELPRVGSTEEWDIINLSAQSTHPIHLHLVQFQILNRQSINTDATAGYPAAWDAAFGSSANPVDLPKPCLAGQFCPDFGPPLPYNNVNTDGAVGGNPPLHGYLTGNATPPDPNESGWKDTATVAPSQVLRLLVRWTPTEIPILPNQSYAGRNFYPFDPTQGYYVWHCHIIDHEDNEMMRPYRVTK